MVGSVGAAATLPPAISGASSESKTGAARATLSDNYETFLKLLTEQLKNQDPLQPQDASEFTNQLVQFSQVEQQIASNEKLEKMIVSMGQSQGVAALGYIGKVVDIRGSGLALQESTASMSVTLPSPAESAFVDIYDKTGVLVQSLPMPTNAGFHDVNWNGKSAANKQLPDGFYQAVVRAVDAEGKKIETATTTTGIVTGVDTSTGEMNLVVGEMAVKPESVLTVRSR